MDWSKQCYQCYKFTIIEDYEQLVDRYVHIIKVDK